MTDLHKVLGSLFMVGLPGLDLDPATERLLRDYHIGGVIYFRRNIESLEQLQKLSTKLIDYSNKHRIGNPLLIGIDQEFGIVDRLLQTELPSLPGAMAHGAAEQDGTQLTDRFFHTASLLLTNLGINMNFAPVFDLANVPTNPQVLTRAFHHDPNRVFELGRAVGEAYLQSGVYPCFKHFPGLGRAEVDTHFGTAVIKDFTSVEDLLFEDGRPFHYATRKFGPDFIMVSHARFTGLDFSGLPASLSPFIITTLLRRMLGFEGVVVTDDLDMQAITDNYSLAEAAFQALIAGSNLLLVCKSTHQLPGIIDDLASRVERGTLPIHLLRGSVRRVTRALQSLSDNTMSLPSLAMHSPLHIAEKLTELGQQVASASITHVYGQDPERWFKDAVGEGLTVLYPTRLAQFHGGKNGSEPDSCALVEILRAEDVQLREIIFSPEITPEQLAALSRELSGGEPLLVMLHNEHLKTNELSILNELLRRQTNVFYVSVGAPWDLDYVPTGAGSLAAYSTCFVSQKAVADCLLGKAVAPGKLPVLLRCVADSIAR